MKSITSIIILFVLAHCTSTRQLPKEITTETGLKYTVLKTGKGKSARAGNEVAIYESMGYLNGQIYFSIERPKQPVKFTLGGNQAIDGIDEGVTGMKVGEIRKLIIPPALSKRSEYPPNLSPDSTLLYKIELVEITITKQ